MNDIAIFQGWLLFAKWLYLILIFIMLAVVFKGINGKIFANE